MAYKIAVLISGNGSNMLNIVKSTLSGEIKSKVVTIVSNNPDALGIKRAKKYDIPIEIINDKSFKNKDEYEDSLTKHLLDRKINLICLAGFMKILSKKFVNKWEKKIINIHPSLLPSFKGLDTHKRAIEMKVKYSGCTVHYVNTKVDEGEIIDQEVVKIQNSDNADSLRKKILMKEHKLYIKVLKSMEKFNG